MMGDFNVIEEGTYVKIYDKRYNTLFAEGNYINDKKDGVWKEWRKDGKLVESATFKNGELHGLYEHYFCSGKLAMRAYYNNEELCGPFELYHSNGQLSLRIERDGKTVRYTESGKQW
jgi:antitoxin component YwqK of YwqJK toxin-antitoxin module